MWGVRACATVLLPLLLRSRQAGAQKILLAKEVQMQKR